MTEIAPFHDLMAAMLVTTTTIASGSQGAVPPRFRSREKRCSQLPVAAMGAVKTFTLKMKLAKKIKQNRWKPLR